MSLNKETRFRGIFLRYFAAIKSFENVIVWLIGANNVIMKAILGTWRIYVIKYFSCLINGHFKISIFKIDFVFLRTLTLVLKKEVSN